MDEPLIYTSKGNLPIASLRHKTVRQDKGKNIVFAEEYWLGDECVKRAVHVLPLVPKRNLWTALQAAYQTFREVLPKKNPPVEVSISGVSAQSAAGGLN